MDNFLGAIVFLLPGVLAYFWLQSFGVNLVVKHSPTEFTAIAGLLWLPVSFGTMILYNLIIWISHFISEASPIWTMQSLKDASNNFVFLIMFLLLSVLVSFVYSFVWALWGFKIQQKLINWVRGKRGIATLSDSAAVWDEVFLKNELQYVEIGKLDNKDKDVIIVRIRKVSRPFEPERSFCIDLIEEVTRVISNYEISTINIFVDVKTETALKHSMPLWSM